jgi:adenylate kinase family enzyme
VDRLTAPVLLFDGFPRTREQITLFLIMSNRLQFRLAGVFILNLPRSLALQRLIGRRICPRDGLDYNIYLRPPRVPGICDRCGTPLRQRSDDRPEIAERRLSLYERDTVPVLEYFRINYPLVTYEVDAARPVDRVALLVSSVLGGTAAPATGRYPRRCGRKKGQETLPSVLHVMRAAAGRQIFGRWLSASLTFSAG